MASFKERIVIGYFYKIVNQKMFLHDLTLGLIMLLLFFDLAMGLSESEMAECTTREKMYDLATRPLATGLSQYSV